MEKETQGRLIPTAAGLAIPAAIFVGLVLWSPSWLYLWRKAFDRRGDW